MKAILGYLQKYYQQHFQWQLYLYFGLFLLICISTNYYLDFESRYIAIYTRKPEIFIYYFGFYAFAYYGMAIPQALFTKSDYIYQPKFYLKSAFLLALITFSGGFYFHHIWAEQINMPEAHFYIFKILQQLRNLIAIFLPLAVFYFLFEKESTLFYGFTWRGFSPKPYLFMLGIMFPLILWASFQADFQNSYPNFKFWLLNPAFGLEQWQMAILYEILYGLDFIWIEWIFRGALIIGMSKLMGNQVVLPMVVTYAFLHFEKPLGETIGSVFGGYILGVIALYSRSIWGGIMIHVGVAYMMESMAILQHYLKNW